MVYLIWAVLGVLAFVYKKNKYVTIMVFAFIAILFCCNTANADLDHYFQQYNGAATYATEPLYNLFGQWFYAVGADFYIFRGFFFLLALALITWTFHRLTPYPTLALFMYSIYPLALDVTQIRYTIAYAIVFFGLYYLMRFQNTYRKKDIFIFLLSVLIASGFHYVCALFAILGLLALDIRKHRLLYLIIIPLIVIAALSMVGRLAPLVEEVIGMGKTQMWIASERQSSIIRIARIMISRLMLPAFSIMLAFSVKNDNYKCIYGARTNSLGLKVSPAEKLYVPEKDPRGYYSIRNNRFLFTCLYYICLYSILELTIAGDYERLARLGLLIGSALVTRQMFYLEEADRRLMMFLYICIFSIIFVFVMFFMKNIDSQPYIGYVFRQVMESNSVFGITYEQIVR